MEDTFKLPKKFDEKELFDYELKLMKESLRRRGIVAESKEDILSKLSDLNQKENMCVSNRPPMPSEYFEAIPHKKWLGHGFFYKSGGGRTVMDKDNAYEDYDTFDNFCRLTKCKVLLADYDDIRRDFNLSNFSNEEIDGWLLRHFCYLSTGQVERMKKGGDLENVVSENWSEMVDENDTKVGLRQRGGGRACTFFVDDELKWDENGRIVAKTAGMDLKGNGVCLQQPKFGRKATGFLSYSDALKGFCFERAVRKILELDPSCNWSTVRSYAIIDIGIRWRDKDPATGIEGDKRNCLMLRAAHSRYSGSMDEPVYYSVVQMPALETEQGKRLISAFRKVDCSSEQSPCSPVPLSWNVQCTASFDHLVDFSQWYFFPGEGRQVLPKFRMSEQLFKDTLRLQGEFTFRNPEAMYLAYGTKDEEEARKMYGELQEELKEKAKGYGTVGKGKPDISWSWQVDMDDCVAFRTIIDFSCGEVEKIVPLEMIQEWLKL